MFLHMPGNYPQSGYEQRMPRAPHITGERFLLESPGTWIGEFELWFEPGAPAVKSVSRATITSELRGRTALLRYTWRFDAEEHEGIALLGRADDGTFRMAWTETFGYPGNIMDCSSDGDRPRVLGQYEADGRTWGWRTEFDLPSINDLVIRTINIAPDGTEALASLARYRRS
ncbi:MAG: hypothetical protein JWM25_300 [Thermoleophilia bacterium]|nr:hypothetical protein [Thermoleophilia bacterium]MCZ4495717.1 hypothetical protein [Thermoleophilia bacterium]